MHNILPPKDTYLQSQEPLKFSQTSDNKVEWHVRQRHSYNGRLTGIIYGVLNGAIINDSKLVESH